MVGILYTFLLGRPIFRGELFVSGSVVIRSDLVVQVMMFWWLRYGWLRLGPGPSLKFRSQPRWCLKPPSLPCHQLCDAQKRGRGWGGWEGVQIYQFEPVEIFLVFFLGGQVVTGDLWRNAVLEKRKCLVSFWAVFFAVAYRNKFQRG